MWKLRLEIPQALQNLTFSDDGVDWPHQLDDGTTLIISIREIRQAKTGMHALLAITAGERVLGHDTFNIGRSEERTRLANRAHSGLGSMAATTYTKDSLRHDLDLITLWLIRHYEQDRFQFDTFANHEEASPRKFKLKPYVLSHAGTVAFGTPGSGKSYLWQAAGICLSLGLNGLWEINEPAPVAYVNLERSRDSLLAREISLRTILGIEGDTGVQYMHVRGRGLSTIMASIMRWAKANPEGVIILDSVSRTGLGDLNSNETGNLFINSMNALECAWIGIGHPPRGESDHIYGSTMFDAGQDIGIQITSELRENTRGVAWKVVKANDMLFPPVTYFAMDFAEDGSGLTAIRQANKSEFPELAASRKMSQLEQITTYILDQAPPKATPTQLSTDLDIPRPNVQRILRASTFVKLAKEGKEQPYGVAVEAQK